MMSAMRYASILAGLVVLWPAVAAAKPSRADVDVDTSEVGAPGPIIQRRVGERGDVVLREAGVLPAEHASDPVFHVRVVEVLGDEPGFRAQLWVERRGVPIGERRAIDCELCTETELVARVEGELKRLLRSVHDEPAPEAAAVVPAPSVAGAAPPPSVDAPPSRRLGAKGKAGVTLLALGGAALVTGIGLSIPDWEPVPGDPLRERSTRYVGFGVLGGAAVLVAVGGTLLGIDRRAPKMTVGRTALGGWVLAFEHRF